MQTASPFATLLRTVAFSLLTFLFLAVSPKSRAQEAGGLPAPDIPDDSEKEEANALEWSHLNQSEVAVSRALEWLRVNQSDDGAWSESQNPADRVTFAALGTLAFLAHGETTVSEAYGKTVVRSLEFLLVRQDSQGAFAGGADTPDLHVQAVAVYALAEAYGMMRIPHLRPPMEKGVAVLLAHWPDAIGPDSASTDGTPLRDSSLPVWYALALRAARIAGAANPGLAEAAQKASVALKTASRSVGDPPGPGAPHEDRSMCDWYFLLMAKSRDTRPSWRAWKDVFGSRFIPAQMLNGPPSENGSWAGSEAAFSGAFADCEDCARVWSTLLATLALQAVPPRFPSYIPDEDLLPGSDVEITIL